MHSIGLKSRIGRAAPPSRRKQKKEYTLLQQKFKKQQSEAARDALDGKTESGVEDPKKFLIEWETIMARPVPPPIQDQVTRTGAAVDPFFLVSAQDIKQPFPLVALHGPRWVHLSRSA